MTYKGEYSSGTSYNVGEVVKFTDGVWYILQESASAGTPCNNTLYWGRASAEVAEIANMMANTASTASSASTKAASNLTKINKLITKVPDLASDAAAGTYTLKVTKAEGGALTYAWTADE